VDDGKARHNKKTKEERKRKHKCSASFLPVAKCISGDHHPGGSTALPAAPVTAATAHSAIVFAIGTAPAAGLVALTAMPLCARLWLAGLR
jgi:hypothetical protein